LTKTLLIPYVSIVFAVAGLHVSLGRYCILYYLHCIIFVIFFSTQTLTQLDRFKYIAHVQNTIKLQQSNWRRSTSTSFAVYYRAKRSAANLRVRNLHFVAGA